jgi:hypothetical protein
MKQMIVALACLLAGCAASSDQCQPLSLRTRFCLLPPSSAAPFSASQMVRADVAGQREWLVFSLENAADGFAGAALTPMGQGVLNFRWDGTKLDATSPFGPRVAGQAARLVSLIQMMRWPEQAVLDGVQGASAQWRHENDKRQLMVNGEPVLTLQPAPNGGTLATMDGMGQVEVTPLEEAKAP